MPEQRPDISQNPEVLEAARALEGAGHRRLEDVLRAGTFSGFDGEVFEQDNRDLARQLMVDVGLSMPLTGVKRSYLERTSPVIANVILEAAAGGQSVDAARADISEYVVTAAQRFRPGQTLQDLPVQRDGSIQDVHSTLRTRAVSILSDMYAGNEFDLEAARESGTFNADPQFLEVLQLAQEAGLGSDELDRQKATGVFARASETLSAMHVPGSHAGKIAQLRDELEAFAAPPASGPEGVRRDEGRVEPPPGDASADPLVGMREAIHSGSPADANKALKAIALAVSSDPSLAPGALELVGQAMEHGGQSVDAGAISALRKILGASPDSGAEAGRILEENAKHLEGVAAVSAGSILRNLGRAQEAARPAQRSPADQSGESPSQGRPQSRSEQIDEVDPGRLNALKSILGDAGNIVTFRDNHPYPGRSTYFLGDTDLSTLPPGEQTELARYAAARRYIESGGVTIPAGFPKDERAFEKLLDAPDSHVSADRVPYLEAMRTFRETGDREAALEQLNGVVRDRLNISPDASPVAPVPADPPPERKSYMDTGPGIRFDQASLSQSFDLAASGGAPDGPAPATSGPVRTDPARPLSMVDPLMTRPG